MKLVFAVCLVIDIFSAKGPVSIWILLLAMIFITLNLALRRRWRVVLITAFLTFAFLMTYYVLVVFINSKIEERANTIFNDLQIECKISCPENGLKIGVFGYFIYYVPRLEDGPSIIYDQFGYRRVSLNILTGYRNEFSSD